MATSRVAAEKQALSGLESPTSQVCKQNIPVNAIIPSSPFKDLEPILALMCTDRELIDSSSERDVNVNADASSDLLYQKKRSGIQGVFRDFSPSNDCQGRSLSDNENAGPSLGHNLDIQYPDVTVQLVSTSLVHSIRYKRPRVNNRSSLIDGDASKLKGEKMSVSSPQCGSDNTDLSTTQEFEHHVYENLGENGTYHESSESQPILGVDCKDATYPATREEDEDFIKLDFAAPSPTQHSSQSQPQAHDPKTPAPQNPFNISGAVLNSRDLFTMTQASPAVGETPFGSKLASSQRPSPNLFNQKDLLRTSVSPSNRSDRLQVRADAAAENVISSSPQLLDTISNLSKAQPRGIYTSVQDSQQKKRDQLPIQTASQIFDGSVDDFMIGSDVKSVANARRAKGLMALSTTSSAHIQSLPRSDHVEVPSTAKNRHRRSATEEYVAHCTGLDARDSQQEPSLVKDSQTQSQLIHTVSQAILLSDNVASQLIPESHQSLTQSQDHGMIQVLPEDSPSIQRLHHHSFVPLKHTGELTSQAATVSDAKSLINAKAIRRESNSDGDEIDLKSEARLSDTTSTDSSPGLDDIDVVDSSPADVFQHMNRRRTRNVIPDTSSVGTPSMSTSSLSSLAATTPTNPGSSSATGSSRVLDDTSPQHKSTHRIGRELIAQNTPSSASSDIIQDPKALFAPTPLRGRGRPPRMYGKKTKPSSKILSSMPVAQDLIVVEEKLDVPSKKQKLLKPSSRTLRALAKSDSIDVVALASTPIGTATRSSRKADGIFPTTPKKSLRGSCSGSRTGGHGLFGSMVFCVSYVKSIDEKDRVYNLIKQHEGAILETGFNELFESTSSGNDTLSLKSNASGFGFACLIADQHSRRTKYMQALALGLPCISGLWVEHCVRRSEILSWEPYLLAAGQSSLLHGAIKSRNLIGYSALGAKFSETLNVRNRILNDKKILLVIGRGKSERKEPYQFLLQALGASCVRRVSSNEEARQVLLKSQANADEWDWVYIDDDKIEERRADSEKAILGPVCAQVGQKRKRGSTPTASDDGQVLMGIKIVGDEYIIQSLISGGLIDQI